MFILTKYYEQKDEWSQEYRIYETYNKFYTSNTIFLKRGHLQHIDDNIMFSLHLALNTCRNKGIQSFQTIPDIEQKTVCNKLLKPHNPVGCIRSYFRFSLISCYLLYFNLI